MSEPTTSTPRAQRPKLLALAVWCLGLSYPLLLAVMLVAGFAAAGRGGLTAAIQSEPIRGALTLTLTTATLSSVLATGASLALAYLVTRGRLRGGLLLEAVLDTPHVAPPIVLGLLLLLAFTSPPLAALSQAIVYEPSAVVLAQAVVAASFAAPALTAVLRGAGQRSERIAETLGCTAEQAFLWTTLPLIRPAVSSTAILSWARCVGAFGPVLVFAGATRGKTEVLSTAVYTELSSGDLDAAVGAAMLTVLLAAGATTAARWLGKRTVDRGGA